MADQAYFSELNQNRVMHKCLDIKIFNEETNHAIITAMNKDIIDELQNDWSVQRPDLNSEPMGVVLRIQALAKIFGDQTANRLQEFDLQWWQYDALSTLRRQGKPFIMAATELAEANMLTSGAMTNRIDRLEEDKLVRRIKDDNDGRRVLVQLTTAGLKLIEAATKARFETATDALEGLNTQQRDSLNDLLRLVLKNQDN
jgi:DNA-binding MarR family transcriptional regulator